MMNPKPSEEQGHFLTLNACNIPTLGRHSKAGKSLLEKAMKCINALYTPPFFVDYETKNGSEAKLQCKSKPDAFQDLKGITALI